jgi:hypothetical protein
MKKVEISFAHFHELCLFRRSSNVKDCQINFDKKMLKGIFPDAEITSAIFVFGATINESMTA